MNFWQAVCIITGTVYDSQHHPVPAARVYLESADKKEMTARTDPAGVYRFSVAKGTFVVRVEGGTATVTVQENETVTADLTEQAAFFDEPQYKAAGMTDYTYQGGHGSDAVFRSAGAMAKALEGESAGDANETSIYSRATELLNRRKARAAAEVFREGVGKFPHSARMLLGMGSACYMEEAWENAAEWFFRATDLTPADPKPYLFLGRVQARQITQLRGYRERMARLVKLQPESALANYYYGATLEGERARDAFQKAVRIDPKMALAHVRLGAIAVLEGKYGEGIREYKAAVEAEPGLEEAHYRLSEAYRLAGDSTGAKQEMVIFRQLTKEAAGH